MGNGKYSDEREMKMRIGASERARATMMMISNESRSFYGNMCGFGSVSTALLFVPCRVVSNGYIY